MKTFETKASATARTIPSDMKDAGRVAIGNVQSPFKAGVKR